MPLMRRAFAALVALALVWAPLPASAQVGRVSIEAPLAPTPTLTGAVDAAASIAPLSPASLTPALTPALASALVPAPALPQPVSQPLPAAAEAIRPIGAKIVPAGEVVRAAANSNRLQLVKLLAIATERAAAAPETISSLYEQGPAAPDLERLASVKTPAPPAPWRPNNLLLKPAAAVLNSMAASRYAKRLANRMPHERVTTEEMGMQDTLVGAHRDILSGRLQDALTSLSSLFKGRDANGWFRANTGLLPYQFQGQDYIRFIERAVKLAYERAHSRARDSGLIAEARAAARDGSLVGHEWRVTPIQEKDSAHCAHHALFNAISASVGFVYPLSVSRFVDRARELLNVRAEAVAGARGAELAALESSLGLKLGVDVGEGMGVDSIKKWAKMLGLGVESRGPPQTEAQWTSLIGPGREVMLSLRMFHERFPHTPQERELHGHDYEVIHHAVYLLGSFVSPSRGVRLFMVQDSGSGATDFYTAEELTAVAYDVQLLRTAHAVSLP